MATFSLSNVGPIYRREIRSYFQSPVAYVVIVVFLAIVGWFFTSDLFLINVASLRIVFELVPSCFSSLSRPLPCASWQKRRNQGPLSFWRRGR